MPDTGYSPMRPGGSRWLTAGVASYGSWLVFNLFLAVLFPVFVLLGALSGRAGRQGLRRIFVFFLKLFFIHYLPFIRVYRFAELPDPKRLRFGGARVIVANHRSWLDALLILILVPDAIMPVNTAYTRIPLLGRVMIWLGCVPLASASRESVVEGMEQIRSALMSGATIAGFPEGRRSRDGTLRPFGDALFRLAIETGAPVIPVLLHSDLPYLSPEKGTLLTPRQASWKIRMLDEVRAKTGERGADLGRRVRKAMEIELGRLDSNLEGSTERCRR